LANSLVGKSTKTLGALPYPVFLDALAGPFVIDSKMGNTKASVLPCIANKAKLNIQNANKKIYGINQTAFFLLHITSLQTIN
jgi:hypothetical protein